MHLLERRKFHLARVLSFANVSTIMNSAITIRLERTGKVSRYFAEFACSRSAGTLGSSVGRTPLSVKQMPFGISLSADIEGEILGILKFVALPQKFRSTV